MHVVKHVLYISPKNIMWSIGLPKLCLVPKFIISFWEIYLSSFSPTFLWQGELWNNKKTGLGCMSYK